MNKRAIISAVLSIIPGLGQMYLGYWRRGLTIFLGVPALALMLWGVGLPWLITGLGLVWIWGIFDAFMLADKTETSIVLPVAISLLLALVASWYITEMNIGELIRNTQKNGGMIVRQLVRPDLRQVRQKEALATTGSLIVYEEGRTPARVPSAPAGGPKLVFEPQIVTPNQQVKVKVSGFPTGKSVVLYREGRDLAFVELETNSKGSAETTLVNPIQRPGTYKFDAKVIKQVTTWQASQTLKLTSAAILQTIFMALLGTSLSIILAIPLSFFAARNLMKGSCLGWTAYGSTRLGFNLIRSFEVLVIAVVLVGIVGPGPFAGVLALAIHGIGATGKLYSEAIESIDQGPLEAITATGANRLQTVVFGVIPQIIPQFVSFTMYRWDINVRMATVIGLVGGGGIGQLLLQYIGLTQWSRAATAIWLIAAVVILMDYLSAVIREKLV